MSGSRLERQIDGWLRWYPRAWRAKNGAAIRGALLDQAEADGSDRLRFADRVALLTAGMSARQARRSRITTVVAAALFAAFAVFYAAGVSWSPGFSGPGSPAGFSNPSVVALGIGLLAAACAVAALPVPAVALAIAACLLQFGYVIAGAVLGWQGPSAEMLLVFGTLLGLAVLPLRRVRTTGVTVVGAVGVALLAQIFVLVVIPLVVDIAT